MKTGYCNPRPRFTLKAQVEILVAAGVPESRIYVEGERGETFAAACKAARDGLLHCPDGLRVFGTSQKAIRAGLIAREKHGVVIVDAAHGQSSDKHQWTMYDWAVGKGQAEDRKLDRRKSQKGGNVRASRLEADRLPDDKAEKIWFNRKRFDTDADACKAMNELHPPKLEGHGGWTPQTARRHFGASGRPRGNRSFKLKK
jgi:hypothetical protein